MILEVTTLLVGGVAMIFGLGLGLGYVLDRFVWAPPPEVRMPLSEPGDEDIDFAAALRPGPLPPQREWREPTCFTELREQHDGHAPAGRGEEPRPVAQAGDGGSIPSSRFTKKNAPAALPGPST